MAIGFPGYLERFVFHPSQSYTLPSFYWDVYNDEQRIKYLCCLIWDLVGRQNEYIDNYNDLNKAFQELYDMFEKFMESGFDDYYREQIEKWIQDNFADIIRDGIKQVYFGLTDDGYFCAYVPDSWSEISFDTGAVFGRSDYGRLILRFEADPAQGVIDNTYNVGSYSASQTTQKLRDQITKILTDLENVTIREDHSYATLFTNLDEEVTNGNL